MADNNAQDKNQSTRTFMACILNQLVEAIKEGFRSVLIPTSFEKQEGDSWGFVRNLKPYGYFGNQVEIYFDLSTTPFLAWRVIAFTADQRSIENSSFEMEGWEVVTSDQMSHPGFVKSTSEKILRQLDFFGAKGGDEEDEDDLCGDF